MNCREDHPGAAGKLVKILTEEMFRGARLIGRVPDPVYRKRDPDGSGIGPHFRHNLDFVKAFINGSESGRIDYERRDRDPRIETDRLYAIKNFAAAVCRIRGLPVEIFRRKLSVRSEIVERVWLETSAARELEFLYSHTVHHHALIAEKLGAFGLTADNGFGVALSTLKFRAAEGQAS